MTQRKPTPFMGGRMSHLKNWKKDLLYEASNTTPLKKSDACWQISNLLYLLFLLLFVAYATHICAACILYH